MFSLIARPAAAGSAAFIAAAIAAISCATITQAAQQQSRVVPQRAAPQFHAPQFRPTQQFHQNKPVPQIGNRNFNGNPNAQHFNPGGRLNNAQRVNPNFGHNNPNAGHNNANFGHNNPNVSKGNPNAGGTQLQGAGGAKSGGGQNAGRQNVGNFGGQTGGLNQGPGQHHSASQGMRNGPGGMQQLKPAFPAVSMHNKFWPILKGPKFMWVGGYRRFFVPVGLLGVALIGGSYWYPDGYVSIAGPACYGFTPDGCQLQWRMVDFEDGGGEPQCVQYCPQAGPPPAAAAELPPPPALMQSGNCSVTIYSDPNFAGLSAPTSDNQPVLAQTGWQNEIASIQIQSGTWDFFSGDNFSGESLRLTAGQYPELAPEWNKRIGSFMCVAPGAPGA